MHSTTKKSNSVFSIELNRGAQTITNLRDGLSEVDGMESEAGGNVVAIDIEKCFNRVIEKEF